MFILSLVSSCVHFFEPSKVAWFDNPWLMFPERRYLVLMIAAVIAFQNPLLLYMYFQPSSYQSPFMHIASDSLIGVGIHAILCLWLCILHGLRYHTSDMTNKRLSSQKRQVELQRSIQYIQSSGLYDSHTSLSNNVKRHYEEVGDLESYGTSWATFRMKHDPCGDNWPGETMFLMFYQSLYQNPHLTSTHPFFNK